MCVWLSDMQFWVWVVPCLCCGYVNCLPKCISQGIIPPLDRIATVIECQARQYLHLERATDLTDLYVVRK